MAVVSDDLGQVARKRGIEGHDSMFTCLHVHVVVQSEICLKTVVFPGVRKKLTKRMALKYLSISSLKTENCSGNRYRCWQTV